MKAHICHILKEHWSLVLILAAFVVLGTLYSITVPVFEASDERWHYPFVKHLADGGGLPVQDPKKVQPWRQEGSQPPLTYAIFALATFWIDTDDLPELQWENPHARIGVPLSYGNKNMMIHTDREAFPYQGATLAVHIIRALSLFIAAGSVLFTYLIALEIFPLHKTLATTAALFHAFNPMFLFIAASVSNDSVVVFLSSLALLLALRLIKRGTTTLRLAALGVVIGLGALSKLSALGLLPLVGVLLIYLAWKRRSFTFLLRAGVLVFLPATLIAFWWYCRNWLLYNDILGLNMMGTIVRSRETTPSLLDLARELEGFWIGYWSLFGGVNLLSAGWVYFTFDTLSVLALAGLAMRGVGWLVARDREELPYLAFLALWLAILLAALVRWTLMVPASTGRLIFPGISAISLFLALGLMQLTGKRFRAPAFAALGGVIFTIALISPFAYIAPAYARPTLLSQQEIEVAPHNLNVDYGHQLALLGCEMEEQTLARGDPLLITLYWLSTAPMEQDYSISIKVLGPGEEALAQIDTYPGLGTFPTSLWEVGDAIAETYAVPIEKPVPFPIAALIEVVVYQWPTFETLDVYDGAGQPVGRVVVGRVKLLPKEEPSYLPTKSVSFTLGERVELIGYDVEPEAVSSGETLSLTLYWRGLRKMSEDYTIFTHFIDASGQIWGQKDGPPVNGWYPTSFWSEGEVIEDHYLLVIDPQTVAGEYLLEVGMYRLATGERLPITAPPGLGTSILLQQIQVTE